MDGTYGKLTLNADGTYTYTLTPGVDVPKGGTYTDNFTYTITDADGDTSEAKLTIHITGDENVPVVTVDTPEAGEANIMVDEGTQPEHGGEGHAQSGSGSFIVDLKGEDGTIEVGGFTITIAGGEASTSGEAELVHGVTLSNVHAELVDGKWTVSYGYELGGRQEHGADNSPTDETLTGEFPILVTDATGDTAEGKLTVEVHDDVPTIGSFEHEMTESFDSRVNGNALSGAVAGADAEATFAWNLDDQAQYGTIVRNDNGTYTYTLDNNNPVVKALDANGKLTEEFTYTYTDADGDVATGSVTITIHGMDYGVSLESETLTVYESCLDDGSQAGQTGVPTIAEGSISIYAPDGMAYGQGSIVIEDKTVYANGQFTGETFATDEGILTVTGFDAATGELTFTYTLNDNTLEHNTDATNTQVSHSFNVHVTDANGSWSDTSITVTIVDDVPTITASDMSTSVVPGSGALIISEGTVTAESGADGFADAYTDIHARFDLAGMVNEGILRADGTSGIITVLVDGQQTDVTLTLSEGASGDSILTGTMESGEQLFTATLDEDGNWSMEQYEDFRVTDGTGEGSNQFGLVFKTEDADGDIVNTTVKVPLEVVDKTPVSDNTIDNGNDTITITGGEGIAGTVAAGDAGGVEVQTTVQPGESYNISIMLDLSGSMAEPLDSSSSTTRIQMAVEALKNFFTTSLQGHDGDISLQLVGFGTGVLGTRTWTIDGDATAAEKQQVYNEFASQLDIWQKQMDSGANEQGTNYVAAMEKATEWFSKDTAEDGVADNGGENLAFFLSDGQPTADNSDFSNQQTVEASLQAAQALQQAGGSVKVNAISIGTDTSLHENAQTILNLIDNTGGSGQKVTEYPYQESASDDAWKESHWDGDQPLVEGDSELVTSENGLTVALVGGSKITSAELADVGSDEIITAGDSASSVIVYGDTMNTDSLLYALMNLPNDSIDQALRDDGIDYGSGTAVFQWLEENADETVRKDTDYAGWTHTDTVDYMLEHAEELGYETLVSDDGTFYLADAHGDVWNMDGSDGNVELADLTGRENGSDTITGSSADDVVFGQEGNDTIHGGAGDDVIYGGSGNDTIHGDAGNDYIDGGAGTPSMAMRATTSSCTTHTTCWWTAARASTSWCPRMPV